jgi:hypothetical protein
VLSVDYGREFEDRNAIGRILELMHTAKFAANPQHSLGRLQDLRNLVPALIRL